MKILHPTADEEASLAGVLKSMTELQVKQSEARDSLVDWLNRSLSDQTGPRIRSISFERSSAPDIVEVHLEIAGSSFEKAEHITDTFLGTLQEVIAGRLTNDVDMPTVRLEDMRFLSTGLAPA